MRAEFDALRDAEEQGTATIIDQYGTTNPAEFFAVVTEAFFERPHALRRRHPALYAELARFYRQDPVTFVDDPDQADASSRAR
jgi:Mlc titration factor MtfA (ptsG expression regulator)